MDIIGILFVAYIILVSFGLWYHWCDVQTSLERLRRLPSSSEPGFREKLEAYNRVSYQQHFRCLLRLGNPNKLYDK